FTGATALPSTFNSLPVSVPVTGAFFGGLAAQAGLFASVGMRSASTNGQGFHGRQRSFGGVVSNTLPGQNIMFRVSGDIIVPVELLEFEVE
ncbi:MAG: hypothetical protein O7A04_01060, partial [Acidobacteria bacterium]|nr:hypothetical protein [Acidobacteriota bacterium]